MKKRLSVIVSVLALLLALTGCSAVSTIRKMDAAEDRVEAKLDAAEDKVEAKLDSVAEQLEDALGGTRAAAPKAENSGMLSEDQVREIALDHLGFTEDQVTGLRTEYEIDDGVPQFDVSFFQDDWEYEFEIDARDGRILSFDKDHRYD